MSHKEEKIAPEVLDSIPHRFPFLFVDRIVSLTESSIITERVLNKDEFYFEGHYPQLPIMPGVLMCEAIFQTAGIFMSKKLLNPTTIAGKVPVLTRIQSAKFKQAATPGDLIQLEAKFSQQMKAFYFFKGSAKKEGKLLLSIEFVLGMVPSLAL